MRERRDRLRLPLEAGERVGVGGEALREDLDRDVAVEPRVARPVDLPHPARAERRQDLVGSEARAGRKRHSLPLTIRELEPPPETTSEVSRRR